MVKFSPLKMYFGEPFEVGNGLTLYIPTIGDILNLKEADQTFYSSISPWVTNPTSYRLILWNNGIDWNKISDYDLFLMLYKSQIPEVTRLLFGEDIDWDKYAFFGKNIPDVDEEGNETVKQVVTLYNQDDDIEISEDDYKLISEYYRTAFNIFPKVEKAKGRATKEAIIWEDEQNLARKQREGEENESSLLPLVSSCINHPGFKYNLEELKNVNYVVFMDAVQRLQVYEGTRALLSGSYSGFCDTSKVDKDQFNFMRDFNKKKD